MLTQDSYSPPTEPMIKWFVIFTVPHTAKTILISEKKILFIKALFLRISNFKQHKENRCTVKHTLSFSLSLSHILIAIIRQAKGIHYAIHDCFNDIQFSLFTFRMS